MFTSKLHRKSFNSLLSCHQHRRVNSSKKTSHTSGSQSQFRIFTFLARDNMSFLYSVWVIYSNKGETFSLMLPCSGLLKFFLPTSDLSFYYVSSFPHFLLLSFCCHSGCAFSTLCARAHLRVHVARPGAFCQKGTFGFLHLRQKSLAFRKLLLWFGQMCVHKSCEFCSC